MSDTFSVAPVQSRNKPCIIFIGMPGVGKSTASLALAKKVNWAYVDTDYIIESAYGVPLQQVTDAMSKDSFLDVEASTLKSLRLNRAIVATGGSVVYRDDAMQHLKKIGIIVYLQASLKLIKERIAIKPDRGIAIGPNETLEDLYAERSALYNKYADVTIDVQNMSLSTCVGLVMDKITNLDGYADVF